MEKNRYIFVTLPTYNRAYKCIDTIKNMLYQKHKKWKLMIIDDGSTDDNFRILQKFVDYTNDSRIRLSKNEINIKLPLTLNIGIKKQKSNKHNNATKTTQWVRPI